MRSRPSLKRSTLRILASGLAGLALVTGAAASILAQRDASMTSAGKGVQVLQGTAIKGSFRSGVVNLATLPAASAASVAQAHGGATTDRPRQTAAERAAYRQWALTHTGSLPKATATPAPKAGANTYGNGTEPVLVSKHDGLSSVEGPGPNPPQQALAVAPGYVFEGTSNVMAVYSWNYAVKYGPWTPYQLFAPVIHSGVTFSDPQITYDAERNRYIIVWLELTAPTGTDTLGADYIDIAISKSSTPAPTNFRVYQVPATLTGSDHFCDYPTLGYDYWGMYVTCVTFAVSNGAWLGNNTIGLSINKLIDGAGPLGWWWTSIHSDVSCGTSCTYPLFRLSPTIEDGVPQAEWITGTDVSFGVVSDKQTVCAITHTVVLNSGAAPTLTCVGVTLPLTYADPVDALQPGTGMGINPGLGYKQVAYRNGQLYFAMTSLINCSGNNRDGIYWAAIDPQLTSIAAHNPQWVNGIASAYTQAGYICYLTSDAYLPTLIADTEGDMTLAYSFSDATYPPSILYTGRTAADAPDVMNQGASGSFVVTGSNSNSSGSWSDYSACALSTNLVTRGIVFCAGEYGGPSTWNTELYEVRMQ